MNDVFVASCENYNIKFLSAALWIILRRRTRRLMGRRPILPTPQGAGAEGEPETMQIFLEIIICTTYAANIDITEYRKNVIFSCNFE
jgi:hypothetical protein